MLYSFSCLFKHEPFPQLSVLNGGKKRKKWHQNEDFLPKALDLFQTLYLFQHHRGSSGVLWVISIPNLSLRLSLERELGCALCIPDWGAFLGIPTWRANSEPQITCFRCLFLTSLLTEWFCCCVIPESAWKNPPKSALHWKSSSIVQKLEMRYSSCFSLQKNLQLLGCFKNKTPPPSPHLMVVLAEIYLWLTELYFKAVLLPACRMMEHNQLEREFCFHTSHSGMSLLQQCFKLLWKWIYPCSRS